MSNQQIINLAIGTPKEYSWEKNERSGIGKTSTAKVELRKMGFVGDDVAHHEFHGGVDRAVCMYPFEHYAYWGKKFQKSIKMPAFGENITATGMTEKEVCIGDIFQVGGSVIQITQGRIPCSTISKFNGEEQFLKQVFETGWTGYFFRVLEEGTITADSEITLVEKHPKNISVLFANQTLFHHQEDKNAIEAILAVDELAEAWRIKLKERL